MGTCPWIPSKRRGSIAIHGDQRKSVCRCSVPPPVFPIPMRHVPIRKSLPRPWILVSPLDSLGFLRDPISISPEYSGCFLVLALAFPFRLHFSVFAFYRPSDPFAGIDSPPRIACRAKSRIKRTRLCDPSFIANLCAQWWKNHVGSLKGCRVGVGVYLGSCYVVSRLNPPS